MGYDFSDDVSDAIEEMGSPITVITKGNLTISEYGDETYTNSSRRSTLAVVNDLSGDEVFNREGIYSPGDKIFFFKDTDNLTEKNKDNFTIQYDGNTYRIHAVIKPPMSGKAQVKEVRCKLL